MTESSFEIREATAAEIAADRNQARKPHFAVMEFEGSPAIRTKRSNRHDAMKALAERLGAYVRAAVELV